MNEYGYSGSNDGFDGLLDQIAAPVLILNLTGTIVWANSACRSISGIAPVEMVDKPFWSMLAEKSEVDRVRERFKAELLDDIPEELETYCRSADGTVRHVTWKNSRFIDQDNASSLILSTGSDVSRSLELELTDSRAYLRSIIDASPIAIITINEEGTILTVSRAATQSFGYEESELLGQNVSILMPSSDQSHHDGYLAHYRATREKRIIGRAREVSAVRKSGERFPALLHVSEFSNNQSIYVGFIEEISDQKRTETQLSQLQAQLQHVGRLGAMGEIATSIAHELNQPLTAAASLAGAASLILGKAAQKENDEAISLLKEAVDEIRRASEVIRHMRDFIKTRKAVVSIQNVNEVIEDACTIALIGTSVDNIEVTKSLSQNVGQTRLDKIQIQQVVVNLVRNAIDAMHNSTEKILTITTRRHGNLIEVAVADTGEGINTETKKHLFEPFFTTKDEGMGIGLSISRSIIEAHHGKISASDNEPVGSIFSFTIPATEPE